LRKSCDAPAQLHLARRGIGFIVRPLSASLRVLFYHRVGDLYADQVDLNPDLIAATPALFERQIRHVARAYHPIDATELLAALDGRHSLPSRAVLVTFDDGYRDFLNVAWPILKRHRVPAIQFISTAFVEDSQRVFWWDAVWQMLSRTHKASVSLPGGVLGLGSRQSCLAAWNTLGPQLKSLSPSSRSSAIAQLGVDLGVQPRSTHAVLSWPELRSLASDGLAIGGHSRTHELLDQLNPDQLECEVRGCRDDLARELDQTPPLFAYPNGNFSPAVRGALERAGYRAGFTTLPGLNASWTSTPFTIRREGGRTSLLRFAVKLLGLVGRRRAHQAPVGTHC
jgi:peptidoglycan/xylan/chitin deacetylase (PgdA/CDA1 family)